MNTPEQAAPSGSGAPSSTPGANPSTSPVSRPQRRAQAHRLRRAHRGLVREVHPSLAACGLAPISAGPGGDGRARLTCDGAGEARLAGVMTCDSAWSCPVCAPKLASARAKALQPQVAGFLGVPGSSAWLVTLTLRHARGDDLGQLLDGLRGTWSRVTSGRAWQAIRDTGRVEFVRGGDMTWSQGAGWHPHVHVVLLLGPEHGSGEKVATWLRDRWIKVLRTKGFDALLAGQDVTRCDDPAKAAAYATKPSFAYEAVGMAGKRARGQGSGLTPFELLAAAVDSAQLPGLSVQRARGLWVDYVKATKGRRQSTASRGLKLAEDVELAREEEDEARAQAVELAWLDKGVVMELDQRRLTVPLLEAVEAAVPAGMDAMRAAAAGVLARLEAVGWGLIHPLDPPAPPDPPDPLTPVPSDRSRA